MRRKPAKISWLALHLPQPFDVDHALGLMRSWASDQRSPLLVLEAVGQAGGVSYRLGVPSRSRAPLVHQLQHAAPGLHVAKAEPRQPVDTAGRLKLSTRHRALRTDDLEISARAIATALASARKSEQLVVQLLLGPRRVPLASPPTARRPSPGPPSRPSGTATVQLSTVKSAAPYATSCPTTASPVSFASVRIPEQEPAASSCCSVCWQPCGPVRVPASSCG